MFWGDWAVPDFSALSAWTNCSLHLAVLVQMWGTGGKPFRLSHSHTETGGDENKAPGPFFAHQIHQKPDNLRVLFSWYHTLKVLKMCSIFLFPSSCFSCDKDRWGAGEGFFGGLSCYVRPANWMRWLLVQAEWCLHPPNPPDRSVPHLCLSPFPALFFVFLTLHPMLSPIPPSNPSYDNHGMNLSFRWPVPSLTATRCFYRV